MSDKIFDLEQQIMQCWNVVDDINAVYNYIGDNEFFTGMDAEHQDKIGNLLSGIKELYAVKFEKCFSDFEDVVRVYHSNRKDLETISQKHLEEEKLRNAWPADDQRIDNIGRNGNDGLHYEAPEGTMLFNYSIDDATPEEWDRASALYWEWDRASALYWESQRKQLGGDE
jgi:hypothetical protein